MPDGSIYMDYNATTPIAPEVLDEMFPYLKSEFGNPSSTYPLGIRAKVAVERAREEIAKLIGAETQEIVFLSGGSEANNMVLKGMVDLKRASDFHIIVSKIEHPSILNPCLYLMERGVEIDFVDVDGSGRVNPEDVERKIRSNTCLISIMLANNETGTIQPIEEISMIARSHGIVFHTDAAQAVGKIEVNANSLGVDLMTIAGHKLYAPKGVGALYIRKGVRLDPLVHGASQEGGLRAGTENVPFIVALGSACRIIREIINSEYERIKRLRDTLEERLLSSIKDIRVNGHKILRLPNTLNISINGVEGRALLDSTAKLFASTGAACHEKEVSISHVLSAMGVDKDYAMGTLRLSLGRYTDREQVEEAAQLITDAVKKRKR